MLTNADKEASRPASIRQGNAALAHDGSCASAPAGTMMYSESCAHRGETEFATCMRPTTTCRRDEKRIEGKRDPQSRFLAT